MKEGHFTKNSSLINQICSNIDRFVLQNCLSFYTQIHLKRQIKKVLIEKIKIFCILLVSLFKCLCLFIIRYSLYSDNAHIININNVIILSINNYTVKSCVEVWNVMIVLGDCIILYTPIFQYYTLHLSSCAPDSWLYFLYIPS